MDEKKKFSVFIAEDELPARKLLEKFVDDNPDLALSKIVNNGQDALDTLKKETFDLLLLDINLPVMSGMEILEHLETIPYVIFTTANEQYAVKAFDIGAIDYLLKPFTQKRFNKAIDRFTAAQKENATYDAGKNRILNDDDKYQKSSLSEEDASAFKERILNYMASEKPHANMDISLQTIAEELDIPPHHFSQVINQKLDKNFYEFLNFYRVEDAKKALTSEAFKDKNILEISYDVGFKSKSTFNMVFKKFCGVTPSQYRKMNTK